MSAPGDQKMWGGRFERGPDASFYEFERSWSFDRRMLPQELALDRAWAGAIAATGILTADEAAKIVAALDAIGRAMDREAQPVERERAVIRAIIHAFRGRQRARKAVLQAVLSQGVAIELLGPVATFLAESSRRHEEMVPRGMAVLTPEQMFVLTRAIMGAIRAAVLEEQPFLKSQKFEDELVRLAMSYLRAVAAAT